MTHPDVEEFAEAVARGEYLPRVALADVHAIYQDGYAAGWVAGQERMKVRAVYAVANAWSFPGNAVRELSLEPSPGCPMPEREEEEL